MHVCKLLLSKHLSVNHQNDSGVMALMIVAKYRHSHVVEMLLEMGQILRLKNDGGATATCFALSYKNTEVYQKWRDVITTTNT